MVAERVEGGRRTTPAAKQIAVLGLPMLIGALSSSLTGVVDTAMMGRYGAADLSAVAAASAVFDVLSSVVLASVTGHQILAARFAGREDPPGLRRSLVDSARFCGAVALALTAVCLLAGGVLTRLVSGGDEGLGAIGADYLVARGPTLLLLVPFALLAATFNAYKRPGFALVAGITANVVNLGLDLLLIHVLRWGAVGNGVATTVSWLVALGVLVVSTRRFRLAELLSRPGPGTPVDFTTSVVGLGWPAIVSNALDYLSTALFFAVVGGLGGAALGGGRIAFEVMVLLFAVGSAFAAAGRILIGRAIGANAPAEAASLWRAGQRVLLVPAVALGLVLVLAPGAVAAVFTSFPDVVDAAAAALPLVGVSVPLLAWTLGNVNALRALGRTKQDMHANLVSALAVQLPLGWLLTTAVDWGVTGAYVGVLGYWLARAVVTEVMARRLMRTLGEGAGT
ncbi:MATE family efflux transporter [Saccharothrix lopnurensis]|uniref:Probable multidrug resistance protein NorM n=1 Tax=Saccharothrix lopnurensis TaxID=1670621 RepID=A0ABW1PBY2_9PSEU